MSLRADEKIPEQTQSSKSGEDNANSTVDGYHTTLEELVWSRRGPMTRQ